MGRRGLRDRRRGDIEINDMEVGRLFPEKGAHRFKTHWKDRPLVMFRAPPASLSRGARPGYPACAALSPLGRAEHRLESLPHLTARLGDLARQRFKIGQGGGGGDAALDAAGRQSWIERPVDGKAHDL